MMAAHADLVGMTIASECVIAGELGLPYAALCVVDNLANGIGAEQLSVAELEADREANAVRLAEALDALLPELATASAASLTVTDATLDGETVGLRCDGRDDRGDRPRGPRRARRRDDRRGRARRWSRRSSTATPMRR